MNQNRYMDIKRLKPTFSDGFEKGDNIVVQEFISSLQKKHFSLIFISLAFFSNQIYTSF